MGALVRPVRQSERCSGARDKVLEVFTLRGLVTYYVLFFIGHETPSVAIACATAFDHAQCLQFFRIALRQPQP